MIVQIKLADGRPDWVIIELQGRVDGREPNSSLDGLPLGSLSLNNNVIIVFQFYIARC
jgi:hypothetical protein